MHVIGGNKGLPNVKSGDWIVVNTQHRNYARVSLVPVYVDCVSMRKQSVWGWVSKGTMLSFNMCDILHVCSSLQEAEHFIRDNRFLSVGELRV